MRRFKYLLMLAVLLGGLGVLARGARPAHAYGPYWQPYVVIGSNCTWGQACYFTYYMGYGTAHLYTYGEYWNSVNNTFNYYSQGYYASCSYQYCYGSGATYPNGPNWDWYAYYFYKDGGGLFEITDQWCSSAFVDAPVDATAMMDTAAPVADQAAPADVHLAAALAIARQHAAAHANGAAIGRLDFIVDGPPRPLSGPPAGVNPPPHP